MAEDKIKKVIAIFGMPRSGTSLLGQILDSSPRVKFRMEPIFSYKLKNIVDENSSKEEFMNFFYKAFNSNEDSFMNQLEKRESGIYPTFEKDNNADILIFKTTRFHQITPKLLEYFDDSFINVISIVRNPCGAINSWISHPNEFLKHNCNKDKDWKTGKCRKTAKEEFWGFNDWKKITKMHLNLESKYNNFNIFKYEDAVKNIELFTEKLFKSINLKVTKQTKNFIKECQEINNEDPYSVYKNKKVATKWKKELDKKIIDEIYKDIKGTKLKQFLV